LSYKIYYKQFKKIEIMSKEKLINIENFEDGQYEADDSMYTDEDNAFLEEGMKRAMEEDDK